MSLHTELEIKWQRRVAGLGGSGREILKYMPAMEVVGKLNK